jgi:hypothetical protein
MQPSAPAALTRIQRPSGRSVDRSIQSGKPFRGARGIDELRKIIL